VCFCKSECNFLLHSIFYSGAALVYYFACSQEGYIKEQKKTRQAHKQSSYIHTQLSKLLNIYLKFLFRLRTNEFCGEFLRFLQVEIGSFLPVILVSPRERAPVDLYAVIMYFFQSIHCFFLSLQLIQLPSGDVFSI